MNAEDLDVVVLGATAVLLVGVAAVRLASRVGLPSLLFFLGIGLALGESGLGLRFEDLDLNKVYLQVFTTNEKGHRLWTKAGFAVEGVLRQHYFVNGAFHDMYSMSVLKDEPGR